MYSFLKVSDLLKDKNVHYSVVLISFEVFDHEVLLVKMYQHSTPTCPIDKLLKHLSLILVDRTSNVSNRNSL